MPRTNNVATNRTATSRWKKLRAQVIAEAKANELIRCPSCRTWLDYDTPHLPNSAEVDHLTPHSRGGLDVKENCQVLCKLCNQTKGGGRSKRQPAKRIDVETKVDW